MICAAQLRPHYRGAVVPLGPFAFTGMRMLTLYPLPSGRCIPAILLPDKFETIQAQFFDEKARSTDPSVEPVRAAARRALVGAATPVGNQHDPAHSLILGSLYLHCRIAGEEVLLRQANKSQAVFIVHRCDLEPV